MIDHLEKVDIIIMTQIVHIIDINIERRIIRTQIQIQIQILVQIVNQAQDMIENILILIIQILHVIVITENIKI